MDSTAFEVVERLSEPLTVEVNSSAGLVEGMGKPRCFMAVMG
jgi:hypothetical protein